MVRDAAWLPKESQFVIDASAGTASAYDGVVHHFYSKPIQAELTERRDGTFRVRWRVPDIPIKSTQDVEGFVVRKWESKVTARYTVQLDPETSKYTIRGIAGRLGSVLGSGTCRVTN